MLQPRPGQNRNPWLIQSSRRALGSQEQGSPPGSQIIRPIQTPAPTPVTHVIRENMLNEALCSLFLCPEFSFPGSVCGFFLLSL